MSSPVTLANMILAVQRRANIENQTGFIPLAEIRERLNYALADTYDKLIAARGQEFFRSSNTIAMVNGVSTYGLPADFYELLSVDINIGNNQTLVARPYMEAERNMYKWYPGWTYSSPVYYRLMGNNINFIPAPNSAYTVTINYYPVFTKFSTTGSEDGSAFDGVNGWEEGPIWRVVSELKDKGEEDGTYAWQRYQDVMQRITELAAQRDAGNNERVHDVYSLGEWF